MNTSDTISTLNNLVETLKDGQAGFLSASEHVHDSELKSLFNKLSLQRANFAGVLQAEITRLGEGKPAQSGTVSGALHRGWINLKSAISSQDEHAILAECERGEDIAVAAYRKALEGPLPQDVQDIVQSQAGEIKAAHDQVKQLRDLAVVK